MYTSESHRGQKPDLLKLGSFRGILLREPRKIASSLDLGKIWINIEPLDFMMSDCEARLLGRTATDCKTAGEEARPQMIAESIPWETFRPLLEMGYTQDRKNNVSRKSIYPLIAFKMLMHHQHFNLIDEALLSQIDDRQSFEEFVGLGVMKNIPNATTVAFFRQRLPQAGQIEELFESFERYLRE